MQKPPNIVLFVADQFRGNALGCDGNTEVRTPNYDALAGRGIRFRNAFTPCPVCVPARATMITGKYPHKVTGTKANRGGIREGHAKLPELLAANGYATYSSGKLHYLPYQPAGEPRTLHGFQKASLAESGRILAQFDPAGKTPGLEDYFDDLGRAGWHGYTRAHGVGNNDIHPAPSPLPAELTVDAWVASQAIRYVDEHVAEAPEKPFFLHVSFPKPHSPFDPPRPYDSVYPPRELTPPLVKQDSLPRTPYMEINGRSHGWDYLSPEARQVIKSHYYGLITFQDEQVGRVVEHLKSVGASENTVFIFVADHGEMLGDFGAYFKSVMYEGSIRVPLIIAGAGAKAQGAVSDALVGLQDLMPTICSLAGIELPASVDGVSLQPALGGGSFDPRREFIAYCHDSPRQNYMVRTHTAKYIYSELDGVEEFYDLANDPKELVNEIANPAFARQIQTLRDRMHEWAVENDDASILADEGFARSPYDPTAARFQETSMGWRHY